jgi:hypothetical protein
VHPNPDATAPPPPPEVVSRLSFTRKQYLGIPLLAIVPVLTLLGVFGEERATARAVSRTLEMRIEYPSRFRYRQVESLDISLENFSSRTLDTVTVSLDTAYISRFSSVRIEPEPTMPYIVSMTDVRPRETRIIHAELWGERYGSHRANITAATSIDTIRQQIRTFVFP